MSVLYRPVLIESAAQAEALPPSTPIIIGPFVAMRPSTEETWGMSYTDGDYSSAELVKSFRDFDLTALVPIEARRQNGGDVIDPETERAPSVHAHRYVTPWTPTEEA